MTPRARTAHRPWLVTVTALVVLLVGGGGMFLLRSSGPDDPTEIVEEAIDAASRDDCEQMAELSVSPEDDREGFVVNCEEQDEARTLIAEMQALDPDWVGERGASVAVSVPNLYDARFVYLAREDDTWFIRHFPASGARLHAYDGD